MAQFKHTMEIFQLLNKSNCRKCGKKTCLAFAAAVFQGSMSLGDCPLLGDEVTRQYENAPGSPNIIQENQEAFMEKIKTKISSVNFQEAAVRTGGKFDGHRLSIKVLGKDFSIDQNGNISTAIHVNPWITAPVFNYILNGKGITISKTWVAFRELKDGRERYPLFRQFDLFKS